MRGNDFCLTNYASVFNGKSIFRNEDIDALVFDDAHVAREQHPGTVHPEDPRES